MLSSEGHFFGRHGFASFSLEEVESNKCQVGSETSLVEGGDKTRRRREMG